MSELINTSLNSCHNPHSETNKGDSCSNRIGAILEDLAKDVFNCFRFAVQNHQVWEGGCDVTATLGKLTINGQCWNWYGGYPHPDRWQSTINQLKGQINILFSFGVKPTSQQYIEAKSKHIHIIHYPKQLSKSDNAKPSMVNWLRNKITEVLALEGVITVNSTNRYTIDNSSNVSSYNDSRSVLNSKFSGFASWFKTFIGRIKSKKAESSENSLDSLQAKNEGMDKKSDSAVPETLDAESVKDSFKCVKCGSNDNEKVKSTLYCDKCLTVMVIESLEDHGLVNYYGLRAKELKKQDDYVR